MNTVTELVKNILNPELDQLVVGDLNFDAKEKNQLTRFFEECNFKQVINEPTHKAGRTLDQLFVSKNLQNRIEVKVMFKYYTDHAALQIKLNV